MSVRSCSLRGTYSAVGHRRKWPEGIWVCWIRLIRFMTYQAVKSLDIELHKAQAVSLVSVKQVLSTWIRTCLTRIQRQRTNPADCSFLVLVGSERAISPPDAVKLDKENVRIRAQIVGPCAWSRPVGNQRILWSSWKQLSTWMIPLGVFRKYAYLQNPATPWEQVLTDFGMTVIDLNAR